MSKDDYHSITPWNSQERFFFTRPTAHKRRRPRPPRDKFFVGDQDRCLTGSCEFFLFCWLAGGVVEGGCGGFLQSCCNRPNQVGHKTIVTQVGPKLGQLTVIWTPSFSCEPPPQYYSLSRTVSEIVGVPQKDACPLGYELAYAFCCLSITITHSEPYRYEMLKTKPVSAARIFFWFILSTRNCLARLY